jgi:DNA (cytosine-5)-methyltransferase 1
MKSDNPDSGCRDVDVCKTLDTSRGLDPSCNQGGIAVIAIAGNIIGRKPENGGHQMGVDESGSSYTLTKTDVHAVAMPINTQIATRGGAMGERTGFGIGEDGDPAFTLQTAHSHAVAVAFSAGNSAGSRGIGYSEEHTPPLRAGLSGTNMTPTIAFIPVAATLKGCKQGGGTPDPSDGNGHNPAMQVRRLTPTECERLQRFPDGYTDIPKATDSPRYKALGNSMAVNVMQLIGQRIELVNLLG